MQIFLNDLIYLAFAAYGICFLAQIYNGLAQLKTSQYDTVKSEKIESNLPEAAVVFSKVKKTSHYTAKQVNPASKSYNRVTIAEMKVYIKEQQIEDRIIAVMGKKLYKARKNDYYKALNVV